MSSSWLCRSLAQAEYATDDCIARNAKMASDLGSRKRPVMFNDERVSGGAPLIIATSAFTIWAAFGGLAYSANRPVEPTSYLFEAYPGLSQSARFIMPFWVGSHAAPVKG